MRAVWLAVAVAFVACDKPRPRTPDAAYRQFAEALRKNDLKTAYGSLSPGTRAVIEERSKAIAAASQGVIKDEPGLMVFGSGVKPLAMGEIRVLAKTDAQPPASETATLEIIAAGRSEQVKMVKDGERWTVDLSESFSK